MYCVSDTFKAERKSPEADYFFISFDQNGFLHQVERSKKRGERCGWQHIIYYPKIPKTWHFQKLPLHPRFFLSFSPIPVASELEQGSTFSWHLYAQCMENFAWAKLREEQLNPFRAQED